MKLRLKFFLLILIVNGFTYAQPIVVKVQNQYEAPVDKFTLDGKSFESSKNGTVMLDLPAVDSVTFEGSEYKSTKVAVADIKKSSLVTLKKSLIGRKVDQIATVHALGLKKIGKTVEKEDTPQIRGMINKVSYLLSVEEA